MKTLVKLNFQLSVILVILGGIVTLISPSMFIGDLFDPTDPLRNNILISLVLLIIVETFIWYIFWHLDYFPEIIGKRIAFGIGVIFLMMVFDLAMYSNVNAINVAREITAILVYIAISHMLYVTI